MRCSSRTPRHALSSDLPARRDLSRRSAAACGCPATTSSPWAFGRYSPYSTFSPGRRVAREGHAGRAVVAEVAEDHALHVDRGAEVVGDPVVPPVGRARVVVPAAEHRGDRRPQLLARVLRERLARRLAHDVLEAPTSASRSVGGQLRVALDAAPVA